MVGDEERGPLNRPTGLRHPRARSNSTPACKEGCRVSRIEAWFSLIEGDGNEPIQMMLGVETSKRPQREGFFGYLVIHLQRDPAFVDEMRERLRSLARPGRSASIPQPRRALGLVC